MNHHWAVLGTEEDRKGRAQFETRAAQGWAKLAAGPRAEGDAERPETERLRFRPGVWAEKSNGTWVVRWSDPALLPLAESAQRAAPLEFGALLGLPARGHAEALEAVQAEWGVDLSSSEVRVGITRGHLLSIVFHVPLDVPGSPETLEDAILSYAEHALGELTLDTWVVSIDLTRSARRKGLLVVPDAEKEPAVTHPIASLQEIVRAGIEGIQAELPASRFTPGAEGWTALEVSPLEGNAEEDRVQISTNCPEALKAALEGLPFDSTRFTRGGEILVWVAWKARPLEQRVELKEAVERSLEAARARGVDCVLCGTGFGRTRDYVDLWILPRSEQLGALLSTVADAARAPVELGFYDSRWARERLYADFEASAPRAELDAARAGPNRSPSS